MAKIRGIEYMVPTLDGQEEVALLIEDIDYPVTFQLLKEPETWTETVRRHQVEQGEQ